MTPKILFGFFKLLFKIEGGYLNFSFEELSLSKYFFMASVLFWIHPRLDFGLGGFSFLLGRKTKCLSLGKISFEKSFK